MLALGAGTLPLALGLLFAADWAAWMGGALVLIGLGAHLTSLVSSVRLRRRPLEMLHAYLAVSTLFLLNGVVFGLLAAFLGVDTATRMILVGVEVGSLIAWLTLAVAGHSHKIVPFIVYTRMRARGVQYHESGRPLLFGDLYRRPPAWATLVLLAGGFGSVLAGMILGQTGPAAIGGASIGIAGLVAGLNLALGPRLVAAAPPASPAPAPLGRKP